MPVTLTRVPIQPEHQHFKFQQRMSDDRIKSDRKRDTSYLCYNCYNYSIHRHLYEMCIIREIHTSLMCFGSVVTMCATYCNQFDSGIWTLCRHLSWTIPVSFHRVHIFW